MLECVLDFETRSVLSLKKHDPWSYSQHPSTKIICLSFENPETGEICRWEPLRLGERPPALLYDLAGRDDVLFVAHNAIFEQAIWENVMAPVWGMPSLGPEKWRDTMALAAHRGLPLGLESAGKTLGLEKLKDMAGNRILNKVCVPKKTNKQERERIEREGGDPNEPRFNEDPPTLRRTGEYCDQDVRVERDLLEALGPLPEDERRIWIIDQKMNRRGIKVDADSVKKAIQLVEEERARLLREMEQITGGEVTSPDQRDRILSWIYRHNNGLSPIDLKAETVQEWLDADQLGPKARRLLELRQKLSKSSTSKLPTMLRSLSADHRARCQFQYQGAQTTGRWAGRHIQPQNLPGGHDAAEPEELIDAIQMGDVDFIRCVYGDVFDTISKALRPMLCAEDGYELVAGDFNAIEARVVLALAGQHDKVRLLAEGHDVYADMAETIFHRPAGTINKKDYPKERQVGKNAVLGLGFQCGAKTFQKKFQSDGTEEFCQTVVSKYRQEWAPYVPRLWYGLQDAAVTAVYRGRRAEYRGISYELEYLHGRCWLKAILPSGRPIYYFDPRSYIGETPWGQKQVEIDYLGLKEGRPARINLYGGLLTENVVQATAREIMANAMDNVESAGYPVILTVHDELGAEVKKGALTVDGLARLMEDQPKWVRDYNIPIAVEGWKAERFRK